LLSVNEKLVKEKEKEKRKHKLAKKAKILESHVNAQNLNL
jgi:hypothetical protein